jgi:hypothetical protein
VILTPTLNADLVDAGHPPVHRLPLSSAAECGWRCLRYRVKHGVDLGGNLRGDGIEKSSAGTAVRWSS